MERDGNCEREPVRRVRVPQAELLARPDLWTRAGLEDYLQEPGIDPSRPYREDDGTDAAGWVYGQSDGREPLAPDGGPGAPRSKEA